MASAKSNATATNDPTEVLIEGATKAAAGRELGMSEEETLAVTSRQYRRQQQRAAYANRNRRWQIRQSKTLRDEGFEIDSPDRDVVDDGTLTEEDAVFGRTDYEMGFRRSR